MNMRRVLRYGFLFSILGLWLWVGVALRAQQTPSTAKPAETIVTTAEKPPPVLAEIDRLQFQVFLQQMELAQFRSQQAQRDFDKARDAIATLVQARQLPGYDLDLQTFAYVKKPEAPKKEPVK